MRVLRFTDMAKRDSVYNILIKSVPEDKIQITKEDTNFDIIISDNNSSDIGFENLLLGLTERYNGNLI